MKWKSLTEAEREQLRKLGYDPNGAVVNRIGEDARVFLIHNTREEIYVSGK